MKPKVLFIMHMPPPVHGAAMIGQYIHDSELINKTFECRYINPTKAKDLNDIAKIRISKIVQFIGLLFRIKKEIKQFKPDLCYFTPSSKRFGFYKSYLIVQWIKLFHKNIVVHFHNKGVKDRQNLLLDNLLYNRFFKNINVILLSKYLYDDVQKYVKKENVYYCPNGVKQYKETEHSFNKDTFKILFLSNMMKEKGVWDLLTVCNELALKEKKFECHFIGKWSNILESDFYSYVRNHNLENYVFAHGAKYNDEKIQFFKESDCFVFPTLNDTFGLVLVEAMQFGIPCISTFEGGIPDVIDNGNTGFIVEKHNTKGLTDKIIYLMDNYDERVCMGNAGKEKYEKEFTLDIFEERLKSILLYLSNKENAKTSVN